MGVPVGDLYLAIAAPGGTEADAALTKLDARAAQVGKTTTQAMASFGEATKKATVTVTKLTEAERARLETSRQSWEAERRARADAERAANRAEAAQRSAARAEHDRTSQQLRDLQAVERERNRAENAARRASSSAPVRGTTVGPQLGPALPPWMAVGLGREAADTERRLAGLAGATRDAATASNALDGGVGGLTTRLGIVAIVVGTVTAALRPMIDAADAARASTARLRGVAIDSGESFDQVKQRADALRDTYRLTVDQSVALASVSAKLARESGDVASAQAIVQAAFTTTRARGLSSADAIALVSSAVSGNAEAIRELTGMKPDQLYDRFARSSKQAGGELSETGRQMALVNGIMAEGARRTGEAATAFDALTDAQARTRSALAAVKEQAGSALTPMRTQFHEFTASVLESYLTMMKWADGVDAAIDRMLRGTKVSAVVAKPLNPVSVSPVLSFVAGRTFEQLELPKNKPKKERTAPAVDTTDAYLSQLLELSKQEKVRQQDIVRGMALLKSETAVMQAATTSTERYAQAVERLNKLREAGLVSSADLLKAARDQAMENRTSIDLQAKGQNLAVPNMSGPSMEVKLVPKFGDISQVLGTTDFTAMMKAFADKAKGAISESRLRDVISTGVTDEIQQGFNAAILGSLQNVVSSFATFSFDVAGTVIDSIGAAFSGGFASAKDVLLSGLGRIFMTMGKALIVHGAVMSGLLKALLNPFTSGPAAIAAGVALTALGASLAGAASGRGGGGQFTGGSLGGLSAGAMASAPQRYTLSTSNQPRGAIVSTAAAPQERVTVQFNGPIIGTNDIGAQNAITKMVRSGMRRGG
ncbi:MAG: hypothetical protein V4617_15105 [Gemmatimonadota bacterium]